MDIKAFRGLSGTYNVRANERDRATPRDIECLVYFLNNTQHKFVIDRRSKGQALLDSVFKHLNLIETDFFGLKYLPQEPASQNRHHHQEATVKNNELLLNRVQSNTNSFSNNNIHKSSNDHHHHHGSPISSASLSQSSQSINNSNNNLKNFNNVVVTEASVSSIKNNIKTAAIASNTSTTFNSNSNNNSITTVATTILNNLTKCNNSTTTTKTTPPNSTNNNCNTNIPTIAAATTVAPVDSCNLVCMDNSSKTSDHQQQQIQSSLDNSNNNNDDNSSEFIEERWLDSTKSIRKQYKSGPPYKFYFSVRFYVSDPSKLADDATRNHLYLQLRHDLLNDRLIVPTCSAILLSSYILQSEYGDYKRELFEEANAFNPELLPYQSEDFKKKVIEVYKQHKSLSSADAEYHFLVHAAKELDSYGVEFYDAKDHTKANVLIGVSSNGIVVYRDNKRMDRFSWAKIIKIMFKKKLFSIQLRRDSGENCDNFIEFNLLSNQACKSFWEECVAQHSFFRLHQPKSPPKKFFSFLNFGSKFQYNGKTEYQTMEESRKRTFSHFSRSLSKRYARRTLPIGRPLWSDQASNGNNTTATTNNNLINSSNSNNNKNHDDNNSDAQSRLSSASSSSQSRSVSHTNHHHNHHHHQASPTSLAESINIIKHGLKTKELVGDFEKLSRKKEDESHEESRLMENIDKNRYLDILPYDSTRVQLLDSMTGDYINASFVDIPVPPGVVNRYIATQGPLSSTCDDFWQMVWEQNSSLIIMVTPLIEAGRVKCHKYWPDEKEEIRYGQILVRNLNEKSKTATIDRTLQIGDVKEGEKRIATQIQYKAWPDHEVPADCSDFLKLVNRVKKHRASKPKDPVIVHCSAGIGRTGVLILMETAICIMEADEPIQPIRILEDMRKQRAMLIQTKSQFEFVAEAICKVYDQKLYKRSKKSRKNK